MTTTPASPSSPPGKASELSNIQMNGIFVCGKQDTEAKLNAMPLNIYDQLNLKLKGKLALRPCSDVNIVGYNIKSIECIGKVVVSCQDADTVRPVTFYVTSISDSKTILGLNFCQAFN